MIESKIEMSAFLLALFNLVIKILDMQGIINLMKFSIPLYLLWFLLIIYLMLPLQIGIENLDKDPTPKNNTKLFLFSSITAFTCYIFLLLGIAHSYLLGIASAILSSATIIYFSFYYMRNNIKDIITKNGKLIIIASLIICTIVPSSLALIDPVIKTPKISLSMSQPEISISKAGSSSTIIITLQTEKGHAWDINIQTNLPDEDLFIYVDNILNGIKNIDYLGYKNREMVPIDVQTSYLITNGTYELDILCTYRDAKGNSYEDEINVPIYVGDITIVRSMPWILILYMVYLFTLYALIKKLLK